MSRALREAAGLRQSELAKILGVSTYVLGTWDRGDVTPRGDAAVRYATWAAEQRPTCPVTVWDKTEPLMSLHNTERACAQPAVTPSRFCVKHEAERARLAVV